MLYEVITVTARVRGSGVYFNEAEVTAADNPDVDDVFDDGAGNDYSAVPTTPNPVVDLSLTKSVDESAPSVGTDVVFTLTVSNALDFSDATGVVVTDLLPSGYLYVGDDSANSSTTYDP